MVGSSQELFRFTLLFSLGLLYAAYFVLRYGGLWTENDTSIFSYDTREMLKAGNVLFSGQYIHGFAYPAWMGSLSLLTGLPPYVMNTIVMPFVGVSLLVTAAYVSYRVLFRSRRLAFWAALLLFAVPDLMFSVLRGNHEKINIAVMLWLIFVLFKSFQSSRTGAGRHMATWVLLFYGLTFLNATANDYFASTLTVGLLIVTLWLGFAAKWRSAQNTLGSSSQRLWLVTGASWLLIFWVMFFVFPPAGADFALVGKAWTKVVDLFLSLHASSNPYNAVAQQWAAPIVAVLGAAFRWALSIASFLGWVVTTFVWLRWKKRQTFRRHFMLALYGGLGVLIAVSIPVDFTGLAAGTNLELRNFTYFSLIASPMFVFTVIVGAQFVRNRWPRFNLTRSLNFAKPLLAVVMACFFVISLFKITLDPVVSNTWITYSPSEVQAMSYFLRNAATTQNLWGGDSSRLSLVSGSRLQPDPWRVIAGGFDVNLFLTYLNSPFVYASAVLNREPLPVYAGMNRVYADRSVELYQPTPLSPFQQ